MAIHNPLLPVPLLVSTPTTITTTAHLTVLIPLEDDGVEALELQLKQESNPPKIIRDQQWWSPSGVSGSSFHQER